MQEPKLTGASRVAVASDKNPSKVCDVTPLRDEEPILLLPSPVTQFLGPRERGKVHL